VAVAAAWLLSLTPALSALAAWAIMGGHLYGPETLNLLCGHLLYGLLVGVIALFAASIAESAATAAIIALAFTIGSWVLDFALAGQPGALEWMSRLSLTQTLRPFEQGLFSAGLCVGLLAAITAFAALAGIWLHPGVDVRRKLLRSSFCIAAASGAILLAAQVRTTLDVSEDRRNSFPSADERALRSLREPLVITVNLVPEDPRYADLRRNVLSKLERAVADVTIRFATSRQSMVAGTGDASYGEVEYVYAGRIDKSRSTSHREILPLLYGLAGMSAPPPDAATDYPGYPLVSNGPFAAFWLFGGLPFLILILWWLSSRPPRIRLRTIEQGG
jgi:hypothetical protein